MKANKQLAAVAPQPRITFDEHEQALSDALVVAGLKTDERAFLRTCQKLFRTNGGSNTPFEAFLCGLVALAQARGFHGEGVTPDDVRRDFTTFIQDFAAMAEDARDFVERYRTLYGPDFQIVQSA